ncbi:MAG: hypothetical protein ACKOWF_05190 [Chloroflexota bacterium]
MTAPPVHVLLAGKAGDPWALEQALRRVALLRQAGLAGRVVVSIGAAVGDLVLVPRDAILALSLELALPPFDRGVSAAGSDGHANVTLGLSRFDDDDAVLLISAAEPPVWFEFEGAIAAFSRLPPPVFGPFRRRIVTGGALPVHPLFVRDQALLGTAGDLRRLVSFEDPAASLPDGAGVSREQRVFSAPWLERLPWSGPFFRAVPPMFHSANHEDGLRHFGALLSSPLALRAIQDSLVIQRDALHPAFMQPDPGLGPSLAAMPGATLRRFLGGIPFRGIAGMHSWEGFWTAELLAPARVEELLALPVHVVRGPSLLDMFGGVLAEPGADSPDRWSAAETHMQLLHLVQGVAGEEDARLGAFHHFEVERLRQVRGASLQRGLADPGGKHDAPGQSLLPQLGGKAEGDRHVVLVANRAADQDMGGRRSRASSSPATPCTR